ncbi:MAG: hypothetical protein N2C14_26870, partial [Planctomycetales bacterium]
MPGYYRYPTIHEDAVVFVAEDDLWRVDVSGGTARRLTANLGEVTRPCLSPDGSRLAFTGKEEGPWEIYCMPSEGGTAERITYLGGFAGAVGWTPDAEKILFSSNHAQPFRARQRIFQIAPQGGSPEVLPIGSALTVSHGPQGGMVLGRNCLDSARWKRYRGGLSGDLWIDRDGDGDFQRLLQLDGNPTCPLWLDERIYFVSDHEGIGNLYSCDLFGQDLTRHTEEDAFYVRNPSSDGRRVVYHAGAELCVFDLPAGKPRRLEIDFRSPRVQNNRKFVPAARFMDDYAPHPHGKGLAICTRGKILAAPFWEQAPRQYGEPQGVRYRCPRWLHDGLRLLAVTDQHGDERLDRK